MADMLSDLLLNDRRRIPSVVQPDNVVLDFVQLEAGKKFQQAFYNASDRQLLGKENTAV